MQTGDERVRSAMRTEGKQEARENVSMGAVSSGLAYTWLSEQSIPEASTVAGTRDPLYLFACHLEWHHRRNFAAYEALVAALDDSEKRIREIVEMLLHRSPTRPHSKARGVYSK
jgi:hypothetical protein